MFARKRRGGPRYLGALGVERESGRSQGSRVSGWGLIWRERRRAEGRSVEQERSMRTGEARTCAGCC